MTITPLVYHLFCTGCKTIVLLADDTLPLWSTLLTQLLCHAHWTGVFAFAAAVP